MVYDSRGLKSKSLLCWESWQYTGRYDSLQLGTKYSNAPDVWEASHSNHYTVTCSENSRILVSLKISQKYYKNFFLSQMLDMGLLGLSTTADNDLFHALAQGWFCRLQIVSWIVLCLEFWDFSRGCINATAPMGGVDGCWVYRGLVAVCK